jgi:uncharacterized LabA/DUF88 family protein
MIPMTSNTKNKGKDKARDKSYNQAEQIPEHSPLDLSIPIKNPAGFESHNGDSVLNYINRGKVAIFVDGSNLFYAAVQLGIEIDYFKLLHRLTAGSQLLRAFFYTGVDRGNEKQQGFLLWMCRNGYRVVSKDLIQLADGSKKANLDVEIAVDMLQLAGHYDTAVLVSGDGDLAYAVNAVAYQGARVEVVSLRAMTSDTLINVADCYVDLDEIKRDIQKGTMPSHHRP